MPTDRKTVVCIFITSLLLIILIGVAITVSVSTSLAAESASNSWTPIFRCIDEPGSEIEFYALDLEDIQSLILESNSQKVQITGSFGSQSVTLTSKNNIDIAALINETILNGRPLSSYHSSSDSQNWIVKPISFSRILSQTDNCTDGGYIPNVWYNTCDNQQGLHIIRNGADSFCTFKKRAANSIRSAITISIDANALPLLSNEYVPTVFDNADDFEAKLADQYFPNQSFISAEDYENSANNAETCLIDVRAEAEYVVSWIEGTAAMIDWNKVSAKNISDSEIMDVISNKCAADDLIVFYCTVSYRAAKMAEYLIDNLGFDADRITSLEGSISRWASERRPLVNGDGSTTLVHTFSVETGRKYVLTEYRYCC